MHQFFIKKIRLALARMIIVDELPFRFVEHEGFNYYMNVVESRFPIPFCVTIAKDCMKLYLNERKKLKDVLSKKVQKVCLTTDTWTSVQTITTFVWHAILLIVIGSIKREFLNFCLVPNHKGETIGRVVKSCLLEWGILTRFFIVTDLQ